ncbi:MAG: hypothetical protein HYR85_20215 [Planctomycetes bacterium]|nr:hypothetical protein [Planctomycetota bacterium]MBI3844709.1 hypothetical protein [Planctomycetota bacterium]
MGSIECDLTPENSRVYTNPWNPARIGTFQELLFAAPSGVVWHWIGADFSRRLVSPLR